MVSGRLADKIAIVTGGASGIGRAGAEAFAREGASVVIADIAVERGEHIAESIRGTGGQAVVQHVDVSSRAEVEALVAHTVERFGWSSPALMDT